MAKLLKLCLTCIFNDCVAAKTNNFHLLPKLDTDLRETEFEKNDLCDFQFQKNILKK